MSNGPNNRHRIRIGMLVSHLEDDFDDAVCEGAMIAAKQHDIDLVILPGRYIDAVYADKIRTEYEYQYNTLFELAKDDGFDALLVLIGTIGSHLDKERRKAFLQQFGNVPIITLTSQIDGYPCISVDNRTGLRQVIEHLIETHNCRKIGFVSGPVTSDDAIERFDVYKQVISEYGIEYDENRVAYGNFSKYVVEEVGELLDRCPDLDAIVFSNDQMAIGGYQAMEQRGIKPGKDILVTGFDDDPAATDLTPHLTTVAMDSTELGYNALIEAVNYINDGEIQRDTLSSSMIVRNSCGCSNNAKLGIVGLEADPMKIAGHAEEISRMIFNRYRLSSGSQNYRRDFAAMIVEIARCADMIRQEKGYDPYVIFDMLEQIIDVHFFDYTDLETLYSVMEYIHSSLAGCIDTQTGQFQLNSIFVRLYKMISELNDSVCHEKLSNNYFMTWQTNSMTKDMLIFDAYDDEAYRSVIDKLTMLHVKSSYLYVYEPQIVNTKHDVWKFPEKMMLKAYHNMGGAQLLPADKQMISPKEIFSNPYFPADRRYTMVCMPLFTNEEHYGLLICELEHEYFSFLQSITVQLCAALKIISLMKQQTKIQKQLQASLIEIRENNELLGELSKLDELTCCYNRRGFFEEVRKLIRAEENEGKAAVMIFADLDSLKTINDRFGHEDGDFALRGISKILSAAFTNNEVIGRIGGDEFVVCALAEEGTDASAIRKHIEEMTEKFNMRDGSEKEYYVHPSVGVYPFRCGGTVEVGELLSHADALLYARKKNKRSIIKAERDTQK